MPITSRSGALVAVPVVALVAALLSACSVRTDDGPGAADGVGGAPSTGVATAPAQPKASKKRRERRKIEGTQVPPDLARTFQTLLDQRATALRGGDRAGFEAVLGPDTSFRTAQDGYFDNLQQLPLGTFDYTLEQASLLREGQSYWVVVDVAMQLDGFDTEVVHTPDRFRFSPTRDRSGYRLTSTTDAAWEKATKVLNQPWEMVPIVVRSGAGVIGVFDQGSQRGADKIVRAVERGIADVRGVVPYPEWSGTVVFYALSSSDFVAGLRDLPGGDPEAIDGVTFTLASSTADDRPAATRVAFNPVILKASPRERDRLVRHELTHVAVGEHDDRAPLWLSEGVAEYVSVQPLAREDRVLDPDALVAAKRKQLKNLPDDADFNEVDEADVNYGLSWWVCESLAARFGQQAIFDVLDDLNRPGISVGPEVRRLLGTSRAALARDAAKLMVRYYSPARSGRAPRGSERTSATRPTDRSRVAGNIVGS